MHVIVANSEKDDLLQLLLLYGTEGLRCGLKPILCECDWDCVL